MSKYKLGAMHAFLGTITALLALTPSVVYSETDPGPDNPNGSEFLERPLGATATAYVRGTGQAVAYEIVNGLAIFQGDIVLGTHKDVQLLGIAPFEPAPFTSPAQTEPTVGSGPGTNSSTIVGGRFRWPNGVVPYVLDSSLSSSVRGQINSAIAEWEAKTAIDLVPRSGQTNYVRFRVQNGICSSSVGMRGRQQTINLDGQGRCGVGGTIHEIGHAVGLWHEQSRNDRDNFVTVDFSNIQSGREFNFNKTGTSGADTGAYDYGSIMHYGAFDFARDRSVPVIRPTDSSIPLSALGQRNGLSTGDVNGVAFMYGAGGGGGGGGGDDGLLTDGQSVTGLAGNQGQNLDYRIVVPNGARNLRIAISGGSGDADLHVRIGQPATLSNYNCRPYRNGNNEACTASRPSANTYYVLINGFRAFSGVTLLASYD